MVPRVGRLATEEGRWLTSIISTEMQAKSMPSDTAILFRVTFIYTLISVSYILKSVSYILIYVSYILICVSDILIYVSYILIHTYTYMCTNFIQTEKSFRDLIKLNGNQIVFHIFRLTRNQTDRVNLGIIFIIFYM